MSQLNKSKKKKKKKKKKKTNYEVFVYKCTQKINMNVGPVGQDTQLISFNLQKYRHEPH